MSGLVVLSSVETLDISGGIRLILRTNTVEYDEVQQHRIITRADLHELITVTNQTIIDTAPMCGQSKRVGKEFDLIYEATAEMAEWMLGGDTPQLAARAKCRNNPPFHLVVRPIIKSLSKFSHIEALAHCPAIINWALLLVDEFDEYGSADDGIVATHMVRRISAMREQRYRQSFRK